MQTDLISYEEFVDFIQNNKTSVVYFSTPDCGVCKVLKPKIIRFLLESFPKFVFAYINCDDNKVAAAQNSVFTVPTLLFFVDGKEVLRKSRNINLTELNGELNRICSFLKEQ